MINDVQNLKTVPASSSCGGQTAQTTPTISILRLNRAASIAAKQGAAGRHVPVQQQGGASRAHD